MVDKLWSRDYESGDYWIRAELDLDIDEPFQIVLEAIVGDDYAGDIAIDDTSFTPGCVPANVNLVTVTTPIPITTSPNPCEANGQFMCLENLQCIDKLKVCDFNVDCPMPGGSDEALCGTCNFDANNGTLCGWTPLSSSELEWTLKQGPLIMGPSADHTTGKGYYVAVAADDTYGYASLRTPEIGPTGIECQVKFWYYMDFDKSTDYSRIATYIRLEDNDTVSFNIIDDIMDSTGPQWKQATVNIGARVERISIGRCRQLRAR